MVVVVCLFLGGVYVTWVLSFVIVEEVRFVDWFVGGSLKIFGWCCGCGIMDLFFYSRMS